MKGFYSQLCPFANKPCVMQQRHNQMTFIGKGVPCEAASEAGRNERGSHAQHRQREQKDTQSNRTGQRDNTPPLITHHRQVYSTRGARGESIRRTRSSCCGIFLLLLQLQVLLLARSEDFPGREKRQVGLHEASNVPANKFKCSCRT